MARLKILMLLVVVGYTLAGSYEEFEQCVHQKSSDPQVLKDFEEHLKLFDVNGTQRKSNFHCKTWIKDGLNPSSVHKIRPMDIKVIAAMGDSITAGTGIKAVRVPELLIRNRGLSWSIGGDKSIDFEETLPNMIKVYNSKLTGFSILSDILTKFGSNLNVATPGHKSRDMKNQSILLVELMKKDTAINFKEDWKVITLFVGANDLCDFCEDKKEYSADKYIKNIQAALDYLYDNVPRAFVNLVEVLNVSMIKRLNTSSVCNALHCYLCRCASFPKSTDEAAELLAENKRYNELINQLVNSHRYNGRDDFTVVVQPFFRESEPPTDASGYPNMAYFAPDCFHLSLMGHSVAADALWNNMFEPIGKKSTTWNIAGEVACPSEINPYLYTYKNNVQSTGQRSISEATAMTIAVLITVRLLY